jgi:hypothetical protein
MVERLVRTDSASAATPAQRRLRFELIFASVWLAVGLFLVPALVFWVGIALLGPYGESGRSAGLGSFYADFFADLATGEVRAWLLVLGPLVLMSLVRLIFLGVRHKEPAEAPVEPVDAPSKQRESRRVEPRVSE